jgi:hypothetical protein
VLDLSSVITDPPATWIPADFGADGITVEDPGGTLSQVTTVRWPEARSGRHYDQVPAEAGDWAATTTARRIRAEGSEEDR